MQKIPSILLLLKSRASRGHALHGAIIGAVSAIVATYLVVNLFQGYLTIPGIVHAQTTNPGLWALDTLPLLFALWGFAGGAVLTHQSRSEEASNSPAPPGTQSLTRQLQVSDLRALEASLVDERVWAARFGRAARKSEEGKTRVAILAIDFNHFHEALTHWGRKTLSKTFGARLQSLLQKGDSLRHLGGDEFAILYPSLQQIEEIHYLAEMLTTELSTPLQQGSQQIRIRAYQGVAFYPDHGLETESVLEKARIARQAARFRHQSLVIYDEALENQARWTRLKQMNQLRDALDNKALSIRYSAQVAAPAGKLPTHIRVELSWQQDDEITLDAQQVWSLAAKAGITASLLDRLLRNVLEERDGWQQALGFNFTIILPLPAPVWQSLPVAEWIGQRVRGDDRQARRLMLETPGESLAGGNEATLKTLNDLRAAGVGLTLANYGSPHGPSSALAYFPFDEVRLSPSLARKLAGNERNRTLAKALLSAAHELDMATVIPVVDSKARYNAAAALPCDRVEGAYYTQPLEGKSLLRWLQAWETETPEAQAIEEQ